MMSLPDQLDVISCQMSAEIIHCLIVLAFTAVTVMLLLGPMSIVIRKMTDFLSRVRKSGRSWILVVPLVLAGIAVWVKQKTPALFLSGFLMFAFSALGPATGNFDLIFFISMFGEVCMVLFFMVYANFNEAHK